MDVISELDTLCIVARETYGKRGVVLASSDPWWCVAGPADDSVEPGPQLELEVAEIALPKGLDMEA